MSATILISILLLSPLVGFFLNGFRWKSDNYLLAGIIATVAAGISFVASCLIASQIIAAHEPTSVAVTFFDWMTVASLKVSAGFVVDRISMIMILVVTGVGTLIHLFSVGYMSHDERPTKYFAYLNLFLFNMLLLVTGDNLLVMFVGWEGVGLCSYLLIGFWFTDREKAAAGMKAFVTNRIGDAGFLLGIFTLFFLFGTVNFSELVGLAPQTVAMTWSNPLTLACLFLFIGATGKSAQIPLYVWLPDAMAGPTPVSALIHAATMVTAGVYMIVRLNPIFLAAPLALEVVAIIGALTAVMAATIGLTQWDIKKILAYSTVSQLGYMFLACGVGAFGAAMFHLMTHAFFKALMFLGSGSVIHAMEGEQDVRKMGGLKKYLPITHWTFVLGWLAIIGMPPFAGFFSKDEILFQSFHSPLGHPVLWGAGVIGAACTAFYMTRLMCLTFWGKSRVPSEIHPHESPPSMAIPLVILGVLSVIGGWVGIPHVMGHWIHVPNVLEHWFEGSIRTPVGTEEASAMLEWGLMGISVSIALLSATAAAYCYLSRPERPGQIASRFQGAYTLIYNKYFVDEFYFGKIINPLVEGSRNLWAYVDVNFIDRTTYVISDAVKGLGSSAKTFQTGNIQQYALYIALGIASVIFYLMR